MDENAKENLKLLRSSARIRDWKSCQSNARTLLEQLDALDRLHLVISTIEGFLPKFAAYYPDERWPYDAVERIKAVNKSKGNGNW